MKSSITPYTRWLTVAVVAFSSIGILPAAAITIITAPGATQTFATGINDNGTVVGYSSALIFEQAFRYDNGTLTNINPPDANIFGSNLGPRATSINNSGQIVGFSSNANSVHPLGFLYDAGTFTTIAHPLGITRIFGINSNGDMVGTYSGAGLSFLYSGGNFTTIEKPLASNTLVQGINDSGQIVGAYSDGTGSHGFLYDAGVFTTIDNPNAPNTHLLGINNAGQIVGYYPSNFGNFNGFIFDAGVFTPIDINGSPQVIPFDINNVGQIAGAFFYFDPNGGLSSGLRGFVLDVSDATATPLPGALPLMVTGLAGLAFVLRRKRMSLVAQSRAFFTLVAFVVGTLAAAEGAKATTLVDTGTPADPNSPVAVFSKDTTRAAQFTLSGNHTINSVEIFFETRIAGDATLKILSDSANVPGSPLFTQTFNFAVAPEQFVPFSGLGVNLGTGTYWIALFGLDTFEGLGRTQPPNPAPFYAFAIDGVNWSTDTAARFAFRVTGDEVAQTPLPAALPLFTSGLGVLGLLAWGRKKKVAALAA